jgi:hypothetical protein
MRKAAGILMIILAMSLAGVVVIAGEGDIDIRAFDLWFSLFIIISAVFLVTGGVFCLSRKYWKLCFASASVAIFVMIFGVVLFNFGLIPLTLFFIAMGILPIVFVCLRKREWQKKEG